MTHGLEEDPESVDLYAILNKFIQKGLRARLEHGSLITGQLYVSWDFYENVEPAELVMDGPYPRMPTVATEIEEIKRSLNDVLETVAELPLSEIGDELLVTIRSVNRLVDSPEIKNSMANKA